MTVMADPPVEASGTPTPSRRLRIRRHRRGAQGDRWSVFDAPVPTPRTTVLDALTWIRAHLDPTLDVRHSCFHASCGTCGTRVNGREVLACVTRLADVPGDDVVVEPLRNQPQVSDLVVDSEALYEALDAVGLPLVRASETKGHGAPAPGVAERTRFEDCIECGLCISACPIEAADREYVGPAVLGAAWRVIAEPRGLAVDTARDLVDSSQGAWRCHLAFECNEVCPTRALPAEEIAHLRRDLLHHRVQRWLHHGQREEVSG
jgi:succinate dehydrogenase iron-sulfur subunit